MTVRGAAQSLPEKVAPAPTTLVAAALVVRVAMVAFVAFILDVYIPPNPLSPDLDVNAGTVLRQILPEGWQFFTKSPRDANFFLFQRNGTAWKSVFLGPQSEPGNLFGFSRISRAQGIQAGLLMAAVDAKMVRCTTSWERCADTIRPDLAFTNSERMPLICGDVLLVEKSAVPWKWAGFRKVTMPSRLAYVRITCH